MLLDIFRSVVNLTILVGQVLTGQLTIAQAIQNFVDAHYNDAREHSEYYIESQTDFIAQHLTDATSGLGAIRTAIDGITPGTSTDYTARFDTIDVTLANIQRRLIGASETGELLPPPLWYTSPTTPPSTSEIGDAVWQYPSGYTDIGGDGYGHQTLEMLGESFKAANYLLGYSGVRSPHDSDFAIIMAAPTALGEWQRDWVHFPTSALPAAIDWTSVLPGDTPLSLLQRQQPTFGWSAGGPLFLGGGDGAFAPMVDFPDAYWRNNFSGADVRAAAWTAGSGGSGAGTADVRLQAPIWPGLSAVTLGTPVDLADGLEITGPLDGVLITVTSTRPGAGKYAFGGTISWTKVGGVVFCSDHGEYEWAQSIGLDSQVVVPVTMKRAASARFRVEQSAEGIVQPWTINAPP